MCDDAGEEGEETCISGWDSKIEERLMEFEEQGGIHTYDICTEKGLPQNMTKVMQGDPSKR